MMIRRQMPTKAINVKCLINVKHVCKYHIKHQSDVTSGIGAQDQGVTEQKGGQGWGQGPGQGGPCTGGLGRGGLYDEVQCIMGNGHMGIPVTDRLTGTHD